MPIPTTQFKRYLTMNLPKGQSTFLWGARKTEKAYKPKQTIVINTAPRKQKIIVNKNTIHVLPWQDFLEMLWNGNILS